MELSSNQLESLIDARFAVVAWLNLTPREVKYTLDPAPDLAPIPAP